MNRFNFMKFLAALCCCLFISLAGFSQSRSTHPIQVLVSPDKPDWTYEPNEEASFSIQVLKHQVPLNDVEITYAVGPEKMTPVNNGKLQLKNGTAVVKGKLSAPGFLRCEANVTIDGNTYRGIATAGYAPQDIQPTQKLPDDFQEFWNEAKAKAAKIPMDAKLTLLPERCTETVDVFQVNIQNAMVGNRLYGILAKPKKEGKYPAVLSVPGAGVRPYAGIIDLAEKGIITLQIGIHGIPVTYEAGLYADLGNGALRGYPFFNLDNRDSYYYNKVYLGCVRAIDFLYSLSAFDTNNLLVWGGSQGGALAIITASLDDRIKGLVSIYPALSDLTGYLHHRAGGWPHMFNVTNAPQMATEDKINVSAYYDVVNFARNLKVPGFYTWGYNDDTCPPTSYYAAYNVIDAPKELYLVQETGHWTYPEQQHQIREWILKQFGK
ncbi:acetylxylan esterase [Sphingobacterium corticibacterium]|nr:acetylxylan esterase [Sphingobacterium corticibacterium]